MDLFGELESTLQSSGPEAALDLLVRHLEQERRHSEWFNARLIEQRHRLGLPVSEPPRDLPEHLRRTYDSALVEAARQAGARLIEDGQIARAWTYFRAVGESAPVAEAIERLTPEQADDEVLAVALQERVHPRKGFELVLANHGTCRAITVFSQYPDPATQEDCLLLLTRTLHEELRQNLARVIARREEAPPADASIPDLVAGRDWLFGEYDYYVDTSHLISVIRYSLESENRETIRMAREMAEYGKHLSVSFRHQGEPPFENFHEDHSLYLDALLGIETDRAVAHFRRKADATDPETMGTFPAQVLVRLLLRVDRPAEAVEVFEQFLSKSDPNYLACPDYSQLCRLAGDYEKLRQLARARQDPVAFLEAALAGASQRTS